MNNKVILRPFAKEDAVQLALLANNIKIASMVRDIFPFPYSLQDATDWIDFCNKAETANFFSRAILCEGNLAGGIGVKRQEDIYRNCAEIGYWLGEPFWSKGVMTEAVRQMTSRIFENTTIERLYAGVFNTNKASMRVLEKAGYDLEAIHRKAITKAGQTFDEYLYVKFR